MLDPVARLPQYLDRLERPLERVFSQTSCHCRAADPEILSWENYIDRYRTSILLREYSQQSSPHPDSSLRVSLQVGFPTVQLSRDPTPQARSTRQAFPTPSREVAARLQASSGVPCSASPTYARQFPVGPRWSLESPVWQTPRPRPKSHHSQGLVTNLSAHRTSLPSPPTVALAPATYTRTLAKSPLQAHIAWSCLPSLYACCEGGFVHRSHRQFCFPNSFFWVLLPPVSRRPIYPHARA